MKVLIVDDDPVVLLSCKRILEREMKTWAVSTASSPNEAFQILEGENFDFFLVDIMMPGYSGYDFIKDVKIMKPETPVLAMSGYPTADVISQCREYGAESFIPKPFKPEELLEAILSIVQGETK
jgi:DNA-binding NarL/FixJ family response regulator